MINVKYYEQRSAYDADKSKLILPNLSLCKDTGEVFYNPKPHDYSHDYLTFVAEEDGTFKFGAYSSDGMYYSIDDGITWNNLPNGETTPIISAGTKIIWKGRSYPSYEAGSGHFSSTGRFTVQGNPMSIINGDNFIGKTYLGNGGFSYLFNGASGLTQAHNLILPTMNLPKIYCYVSMFYGCTSLTTAPELPATTLADECYLSMFKGCTSLTNAPALPATILYERCYESMFEGCTSLTTAPELPATTLAEDCYKYMFQGCRNLNSITCLATDKSASGCTNQWVNNVSATGTFYKNPNMTSWGTGISNIPYGWTVEDYQQ